MNNETEFKWTDELVKEYEMFSALWGLSHCAFSANVFWTDTSPDKCMSAFKQSKQPKKEWEVVTLEPTDKVLDWSKIEMDIPLDFKIKSVRRLSDGAIFTVGQKVYSGTASLIIQRLERKGSQMIAINGGWNLNINDIEVSKGLFTTEDGVDVFEGQLFWALSNWTPKEYRAEKESSNYDFRKRFSNREKAEEYVTLNRKDYSINDLIRAFTYAESDTVNIPEGALKQVMNKLAKQKQQ